MPKIQITEQDLTSPGRIIQDNEVVYIPGLVNPEFADNNPNALKPFEPTLFTSVSQFEAKVGTYGYKFDKDQYYSDLSDVGGFDVNDIPFHNTLLKAGDVDPSYVMAKELLAAGLSVVYERLNEDESLEPVSVKPNNWGLDNTTNYFKYVREYANLKSPVSYFNKVMSGTPYNKNSVYYKSTESNNNITFEQINPKVEEGKLAEDVFIKVDDKPLYKFTEATKDTSIEPQGVTPLFIPFKPGVEINKVTINEKDYVKVTSGETSFVSSQKFVQLSKLNNDEALANNSTLKYTKVFGINDINKIDSLTPTNLDSTTRYSNYFIIDDGYFAVTVAADSPDDTTYYTSSKNGYKEVEKSTVIGKSAFIKNNDNYTLLVQPDNLPNLTYKMLCDYINDMGGTIYVNTQDAFTEYRALKQVDPDVDLSGSVKTSYNKTYFVYAQTKDDKTTYYWLTNNNDTTYTNSDTATPPLYIEESETPIYTEGSENTYFIRNYHYNQQLSSGMQSNSFASEGFKTTLPYLYKPGFYSVDDFINYYNSLKDTISDDTEIYFSTPNLSKLNESYSEDAKYIIDTATGYYKEADSSELEDEDVKRYIMTEYKTDGTQVVLPSDYKVNFLQYSYSLDIVKPTIILDPDQSIEGVYVYNNHCNVKDIYTSLPSVYNTEGTLSDRGNFNVKYITSGGYPTYGFNGNSICAAMKQFCETGRGDCYCFIDPTDNPDRSIALDNPNSIYYRVDRDSSLFSTYATMILPHLDYVRTTSDKDSDGERINGSNLRLPATYGYLQCLADSITVNAPWLAIAGATRGVIPNIASKSESNISNKLADQMQPRANNVSINSITNIKPYGQILWGNRTLTSPKGNLTALSFLNIRNLVCDIKKVCYTAAKFLTFEQNNEILWLNFKSRITPTLDKMLSGYGISGYKIERDTTREEALEKATVCAKITLNPVYAVEDFYIDIVLSDEEITTEE